MEMKQNPFSLYDFLGYFVPGALFLMGMVAIPLISSPYTTMVTKVIEQLHLNDVGFYLPFILIAYLIGHILSFVSSVTLENYSVWRVGYPSKYLLGVPYPKYFDFTEYKTSRILIRTLVGIFLVPIVLWDLLGNFVNLKDLLYARPLDPILMELLRSKIKILAQKKYSGLELKVIDMRKTDLFRFAYHFVVEKSTSHLPKMQNYVALYGFARTNTLVMIVWFWLISFQIFFNGIGVINGLIFLSSLSILAFISYLNFMKFYRRFTLEVLMALSVVINE